MQDKKYFGVMLDMSRNGVMQADEVCRFAKTVKSFGYNTLMLYTEETYEVENEPYFGHYRGRYTQAELKQIVDYCENIGIEVIPYRFAVVKDRGDNAVCVRVYLFLIVRNA